MGTAIWLSLNGIDIDQGKNRRWANHHWLFPPESIVDIDYVYAGEIVQRKPGFQANLEEVYFRLCHLGYSLPETVAKFDSALARWNRTANLPLTFDDFYSALAGIEFTTLTPADLEPYLFDFRRLLMDRLAAWDTDDALLEDFFLEHLDFVLILRTLAERVENRRLPLRWHHQDLVDSGWASLTDITDINRQDFILNHTLLVGRLQDRAGILRMDEFDKWLAAQGLERKTPYAMATGSGVVSKNLTLPGAVRNMIHHPENPHNTLSDDDLRESIELLLGVAKRLSEPGNVDVVFA